MYLIPVRQTVSRPLRREAPSAALTRAVERLFDSSAQQVVARAATGEASATPRVPAVDVRESDTHYTVTLEVPGVERSRLAVSVVGRLLSIETTATPEAAATEAPAAASAADGAAPTAVSTPQPATEKLLYSERAAAVYARKLSLPTELVADETEARLENGVLTLTLVKKRVDPPRHIEVR